MDTDAVVGALRTLTRAAQAVWDAESDESLNPHDKGRVDCPCKGCRVSAALPDLIDAIEQAHRVLPAAETLLRSHGAHGAQEG